MKLAEQPARDLFSDLKLSPEERLLLLCARLELTQSQREELAALVRRPLSWGSVVYKAQWHQLSPMVYHNLRKLEVLDKLPPTIADQLKNDYEVNIVKNLHFQGELQRVLRALQESDLPLILLKGAALCRAVYQDVGLRPMVDLDLLARPEQGDAAQNILEGLGYAPIGSTDLDHQHLPGMNRAGSPVVVEVHRHIVRRNSNLYFDISGFWSRAEKDTIVQKEVLVLAPEDQILHLALNFYRDRRFRSAAALRQLCDVSEVLRLYRDRIRWQLFLENVREYQLGGPVGCVLYLAKKLLDAPVDPKVAAELWPEGYGQTQMQRFFRRRVLSTQPWVTPSLAAMTPDQDYKPGSIIYSVFKRLIPSRSYLSQRYGSSSSGIKSMYLYLMCWREALGIFVQMSRSPIGMAQDLAVDRWYYSLSRHRSGESIQTNRHHASRTNSV